MNNYSISADSRRWWWPSAAIGAASAAAVTAILVVPSAVQAVPEPLTPAEPARSVFISDTYDRPCFLWRSAWNEGLDGFQPRCPSQGVVSAPAGAPRAGLSFLP